MSSNIEKGFQLEYKVSGMFQGQGYVSRRGIPLNYGVGLEATDIDVLGISFTHPFNGTKIICDCKNKKAAKPYERIFWSKGLGEFINSSKTYVSLPRASWDIIKFASDGGVIVLTNEILDTYTKPNNNYGLADFHFYGDFINNIRNHIRSDQLALKAWNINRSLWLDEDHYIATNLSMEWLKIAAREYKYSLNNSDDTSLFWSFLICDLTVNLATQILWICSDTLGYPEKAREQHINSKLTYGAVEPNYINGLLRNFSDLANEMIKDVIPNQYLPNKRIVEFGEVPAPDFSTSLIGIIDRAYNNPDWYISMPQFLDFLLFERGLKGKSISEEGYSLIFPNDAAFEGKLKASKNIMAFVREFCDVDWTLIWSNSKRNIYQNIDTPSPENNNKDSNSIDYQKALYARESSRTSLTSKPEKTSEVKEEVSKPEKTSEVKEEESKPEKTSEVKEEESKPEKTSEIKEEESKPEKTSEIKEEVSKPEKTSEVKEAASKPEMLQKILLDESLNKPDQVRLKQYKKKKSTKGFRRKR
ncbi:hypothetical protein PAEAM_06480 [Paenibacillus sp. GM1FR]|uniref:hypothetical protein n=1 Tax=Paenibacillus sp. GM1FR TaxID=2059267 RepID=UPI000C27EB7D|nr:hypothetical protein [Paenibacillus sp. GM1FR]PJN64562.1 hypothetical protein PAEAM_06480 [Paenibacillus sp. GM1FR]